MRFKPNSFLLFVQYGERPFGRRAQKATPLFLVLFFFPVFFSFLPPCMLGGNFEKIKTAGTFFVCLLCVFLFVRFCASGADSWSGSSCGFSPGLLFFSLRFLFVSVLLFRCYLPGSCCSLAPCRDFFLFSSFFSCCF